MNRKGFTLVEVIIVIAIVLILAAIASPYFVDWLRGAEYKEGARVVTSVLREARSDAISENLQYRVTFDLGADNYVVESGDQGGYSTVFTEQKSGALKASIDLRGDGDCSDNTGNFVVQFWPNGASSGVTLCINDVNGTPRYSVTTPSALTGRAEISKI